MCVDDNLYLSESILVRGLLRSSLMFLVDISLKFNDLRDYAVETIYLIKKSVEKHYKKNKL